LKHSMASATMTIGLKISSLRPPSMGVIQVRLCHTNSGRTRNVQTVRDTLKKLNAWKELRSVQKLLRDYTDGQKADLEPSLLVIELVKDTDEKNLILEEGIQPAKLSISLSAMLLRA
jgi:hypothetical protein